MPIATALLILANIAVFRLETLDTCYAYGLIPAQFSAGHVLSSLFLHDPGTLLHLGGNMAVLAIFGTLVERDLGSLRFVGLYVVAGVLGALLHVAVAPESTLPLVGASGAVFGVLAMVGVLRPRLLGFVLPLAAMEIVYAFAGGSGTASFACHIGGFAAGVVFAAIWRDDAEMEVA